MKYIDSEKLIAEVERICAEHTSRWETDEVALVLDKLVDFIISLQQEQSEVNFKVEERKWVHDAVDSAFPEDGDFMSEVDFRKIIKDTARHFYELGLKARKEE